MGRKSTAKTRIIDAAQRLIWANNFSSTSVDAICRQADVQKGSFYHYFSSKENLALQVLEDQWKYARKNLLKPSFDNNKKPDKQFAIFFSKLSEQYELNQRLRGHIYGCPFGNFSGEVSVENEAIRNKLDEIFDRFHHYFFQSLNREIQEAEKADRLADQIITFFEGMLLLAKVRNDAGVIKEMTPGALQLIGLQIKQ